MPSTGDAELDADAMRRLEVLALFAEPGRFDFEAAEHAWGGDSSTSDPQGRIEDDVSQPGC